MPLVTGVLILAAILVAVALAVLSTIAAVAGILPPRSEGDEPVNEAVSAPPAHGLRGKRSVATGTRA